MSCWRSRGKAGPFRRGAAPWIEGQHARAFPPLLAASSARLTLLRAARPGRPRKTAPDRVRRADHAFGALVVARRRDRFAGLEVRFKASKLANAQAQRNAIARDRECTHRLAERAHRALTNLECNASMRALPIAGNCSAALSYRSVLARGFALVRDAHDHPNPRGRLGRAERVPNDRIR